MKKIFTILLVALSFVGFSQNKDVSKFDTKYLNWYNQDLKENKANGASVEKAYKELLKDKKAKKQIVVAVIDGGVDPQHEDLKENMWVNVNEIPDNGKDDDGNGYIDDIHGWNFLGNSEGVNINEENLESTRIYRKLREKYQDAEDIDTTNKDYKLYQKLDELYWDKRNQYTKEYNEIKQVKVGFDFIYKYLEGVAGKEINTIDDVKAIEAEDDQTKQFKEAIIQAHNEGLTRKDLDAYYEQTKKFYENYYNINFSPRGEVIGDDITDIKDNKYGNPDIKGPDAFHGTFCAGIIGAVRNNNLGVDGIASNVLIMGVRAVPNGDEYDKDIALAIRYAVDNGAHIINMSFGKDYSPQKNLVDDAIKYAESKGVLLVHAAGNDSKNIDENDNFPDDVLQDGKTASNMITVGASSIYKNKNMPATFSNYGQTKVDVFAPGVDIVSLAPDNTYDQGDGTSFAAPVVTGVAALVWSYYPELSIKELQEIILNSSKDFGKKKVKIPSDTQVRKTKFRELSVSGGIVNAYEALKMAEEMKK